MEIIYIFFLFGFLISSIFVNDANAISSGLYEGQWIKYRLVPPQIRADHPGIVIEFEKAFSRQNIQLFGVPLDGPSWVKVTIDEVYDSYFTFHITTKNSDGKVLESAIRSSELLSTAYRFPFAIPVDTNVGDIIPLNFIGLTEANVDSITEREIAGEKRQVFELTAQASESVGFGITSSSQLDAFYDKQTGVLLELDFSAVLNSLLGSGKGSFGIEAIEMSQTSGCLIATAAFGSEMAPQVQQLRELRDDVLLSTPSGSAFMKSFNHVYYSFSPTIADWERENPAFKQVVKITITPLITSLSILNYVDIDSDAEMLGYGIGMILLNIGIYFVAPALIIYRLRNQLK